MRLIAALSFLALSIAFTYNMQPTKADTATVKEKQPVLNLRNAVYDVDALTSTVNWEASKPTGKHNGNIKIIEGKIEQKANTITLGWFSIDMSQISVSDLTGNTKQNLENHLKGADFFDAAQFPTARFDVTNMEILATDKNVLLEGATHTISGNFTMKGVTKNISFPANIKIDDENISAKADFNIDRTLWGINYGSDGKVAKEINIKLDIRATR